MTYSYKKLTTLRPQKEMRLSTFLIALAVAGAFFIPYIITGHGYFLFFGDFNVQQVPFYKMCHEMIRTGNIKWNWETDLGVNFVGSYSFYLLGSPFFWLTIPFPNWMVPYLMGPLLILKFACSALTGYMYIRRFTKTPDTARLCALLYAFSGFSVYNIFFNHFHEAIIFFPLLLLSVELLITENRRGLFAFMVCVCAVSNYFFFFGMVVFVIIYWIVRTVSGCYRMTFGRFFAFAAEAVIGLLMSAFLLLPSIMAIAQNSRLSEILLGWNALMYGKEQIYLNIVECFFFPPDLPARPVFFPSANVKWSSLGGWMPLFGMVGVFSFIKSKKGSWLKRIIIVCAVMAFIPVLNSAFYAFNSAYYARWFYMPILMMALATAISIEDRSIEWKGAYRAVFAVTLAFALAIGLCPNKDDDGNLILGVFNESTSATYIFRFWITCLISVISLVLLGILLKSIKKNRAGFVRKSTVAACIVSVVYAVIFIGLGKTHSYDVDKIMIPQLIEGDVDLTDNETYRVDVYSGVDNTGMYLGLNSINAFQSVVPVSITDFYEYIGEERGVGSRPTTKCYAARSLLSVKYLLNRINGDRFVEDNNTLMPDYDYTHSSSGYYIYENRNYVPIGFMYDYYISEKDCTDNFKDAQRSNIMMKALLLNDEQIKKYGSILKNVVDDYTQTYDGGTKSKLIIPVTEEEIKNDCANRKAQSASYFKKDNNGFTAGISSSKDNLVFFSVPYDEGWTATVNGKPADIEKVNIGFMAVKVSAGVNTIVFNYETPGLKTGIIASIGAFVVFIIYILVFKAVNKKRPGRVDYPEGDILLEKWQEYDVEDARAQLEQNMIETENDDTANNQTHFKGHSNTEFEGGFVINLSEDDENK